MFFFDRMQKSPSHRSLCQLEASVIMFLCDRTLFFAELALLRFLITSRNATLLSSRYLLSTASMVCIVNLSKEIFQQSTRVGIFFGEVTTLASSVVDQVGMSREDFDW